LQASCTKHSRSPRRQATKLEQRKEALQKRIDEGAANPAYLNKELWQIDAQSLDAKIDKQLKEAGLHAVCSRSQIISPSHIRRGANLIGQHAESRGTHSRISTRGGLPISPSPRGTNIAQAAPCGRHPRITVAGHGEA
jgi:hypothetical protein